MLKPFLHALPPEEVRKLTRKFVSLDSEAVELENSFSRVLADDVRADHDLPQFNRSTMDGFAVRSIDTFGASESSPALFRLVGDIAMGQDYPHKLKRGETVRIWTGGALPPNADAVVMLEHVEEIDQESVEILRAVAPFDNIARKAEDFKSGELLLEKGKRLRPADVGMLAALGRSRVSVTRKPRVGIISSGDEIVAVDDTPPPGCVRDVNRHSVSASVRDAMAIPIWLGLTPDFLGSIKKLLTEGLEKADIVVISGGSSMGSRDFVIEAIKSHVDSEIMVHGVSVSPGKPFIMARIGSKPVIGLPGHPVSALVCFEQFVVPIIRRLEGEDSALPFLKPKVEAILSRNVASKEGRVDFVRVRLHRLGDDLLATPTLGKSGMVSSMTRSNGFFQIPLDCEGMYKGDRVDVILFSNWAGEELEKEYLSGHETSTGGIGTVLGASRPEKLSRL